MGEAVGWAGVVIAIAAMIRGEFAAYTARLLAKEKAEADRQAARDKMEFDLKAKELQLKHEANEGKIADNEEKIAALMDEIGECKRDRERLWTELESLKATKKDRTDFPPVTR